MDELLDYSLTEPPLAAYNRSLQQNQDQLAVQLKWHRYLGYAKVALGLFMAFFLVWFLHKLHGIWPLFVAIIAFVVLAIVHERTLKNIRDLKTIITHYERGIARLEDRWVGTGESGDRFLDAMHPYARDLDLFGKGSVFELLCTFRTRSGEETLARWLLQPAPPDEIRARQSAAQELKPRTGLRERLFTAGNTVRLGLHPDLLAAWGESKSSLPSRLLPVLAAALAALWVTSLVYGILHDFYIPLFLISTTNLIVNRFLMKQLSTSAKAVEAATGDLDLLMEVLRILEREQFASPQLAHLQSTLKAGGIPGSVSV